MLQRAVWKNFVTAMASVAASPTVYEPYTVESVREWKDIVDSQKMRDDMFFPWITQYFKPGRVLDLGAACGQTTEYLQALGYTDIVTSDIEPFFIEYMRSVGLNAYYVDAMDIQGSLPGQSFDTIFAQGLTPQMIKTDPSIPERAYRSIFKALNPGGRFVSVCGLYNYRKRGYKKRYFASYKEHRDFIEKLGIFKIVAMVPHMVVPPRLYRAWNRKFLNFLDFQRAKILPNRIVIVLEKI